jgi:predicted transcriptional regulator
MVENTERTGQRIEPTELAELTTDIVTAYVSGNAMALTDLPKVIDLVGRGLQGIGHAAEEEASPSKPEPVVPVHRSISPDQLTCLVCGKAQKLLKRHLATAHELTPVAYRELFDLRPDYPMAAPSYARLRSEMALEFGLGRKQPPSPPRRRARKKSVATVGEAQG